MSDSSFPDLLLANPLPPQLLRLNQPFSLEVPSYTFIDPSQSLTISASLSDGSPLPSWLSFDPGLRRLSGTPPLAGQLNVRFTATSSSGKTVSDTVALSITSGEAALLFNNSYGYGHSISVVGNRAYLATGHTGLAIYNLNQPNQPILLGTYDSAGYTRDVGVSGNFAYLADSQSGLVVIDVSSPSNPISVGTFTWPGYIQANALSISGDFVYVAAWGEGVKIFNISTPGQPVLVGGVDTPGTATNLAVSGNYAYVADYDRGITIINISDPSTPSLAGSYSLGYGYSSTDNIAYAITISGSQAFVVGRMGLEILSLANPLAPTRLSFYSFPNPEDSYWVKEPTILDNKLYMSTMNSGVHVLDISDPTAPQLLAVYPTDQSTDLAIADGYIFVADRNNLRVIDRVNTDATPAKAEPLLGVQLNGKTAYQNQPFLYKIPDQSFVDPGDTLSLSASLSDGSPLPDWLSFNPSTRTLSGTPTDSANLTITIKAIDQSGLEVNDSFLLSVLASKLNGYATGDLLINGTNAFYANGSYLSVADISDPLQMAPAGSLSLPGYETEAMILLGNTIYIAKPYIGLQIVDVSQPDQPILKGTFSDSSYVTSVASWGSYILLGSIPAEGKISIIDVSDPASPSLVNSFQVDGGPYSIQTKGNLVLISYRNFEGLDIYSLDSLLSPALLKRIYFGNIGTVNDFDIIGDFVYLAGSSGFLVLNISDPSNPTTVGSTVLPTSWQRSLQIVNNIAYVTGPSYGSGKGSDVQAIDITDPSNPKLVASYEVEGSNYGVAVAGGHILIGGTNGLSSIPLLSDVNEAPTAVSLTNVTTSLSENTSTTSRIKVADIAISDDALGTNTISLLGADAAAFEVEGTVLYLKAGTSLNYETKTAYAVTVSVLDSTIGGSSPVTTDYSLAVTDVNNAYTFSIIDIPDDLASIKDSIAVTATRAIEYLSTYITWNGVLDFVVRFGGDPSWYQAGNGFGAYGGIESYTGSGKTFAQYEATTGIDLDSDWDVGTWVNSASFTNYGSPVYVDPNTVPDPYSDVIPDGYHDFFSIFLHESIHGLGMWSIAQYGGGSSSFFDSLTYEESGQYFFSGVNVQGLLDGNLPLATTGSRDHYSDVLPPGYELIREFGYYENNRWQISNLDIAILLDLGFGLNQWIPVENGAATFQINGTVAVGYALSAVLGSDDPDGNGSGGFSYSWQTSTDGISWSEAGNTSSYHVADADQGKQLQLVVSYTDGEGFPETVTTAAGLVPLVNNGAASFTISGTASVGNTLSALLVANDPDGNPPAGYAHQWQSSGNGSSWVSISGATASSYLLSTSEGGKQIRVLVSYIDDQGFSEVVATAPLSVVEAQNQPPTAVELTNVTATLAENTSTTSRIKVADIAISDDALGTNTIALSGADAAAFEVEGTALYLKAGTSLDYEAKAAYAVTVSVSDAALSGSSPVSTGYNLSITDVNEAPTAVALTNVTTSLAENTNTTSRIKVADIAISDDALGTNTISLLGADAAAFEVDGTTLYLKAGTSLNYETKRAYAVTVSVLDSAIGGSSAVSTGYSLAVTDVNEAPTAVVLTNTTASLPENTSTSSRIKVADIAISDDALGSNTIFLLGADAAAFVVEGTVLYLKAGTSLDYETKAAYAVTVSVADTTIGGSSAVSTNYSLAVTDVNEAPTAVALTNTTASLPENTSTSSRIKVADIAISDDALGSNTISLLGADAAAFEVDGTTLYLKAGTSLNYETKTAYAVTVSVLDSTIGGSSPVSTGYSLSITDVNEAPTAVELTNVTASLAENSSTTSRIKVADIAISDDALGTNSISLSGADAAAFEVEGTVLYLMAGTSLDYEAKAAYAVTVSVSDAALSGSSAVSTGYSLSIKDVNEAPTAVALTNVTASLAENSSTTSRIKVADIAISDDALGTNSISLSGADAAAFEVEGTVLYLKASTSLNYETKTPYAVTVSVLDSTIGGSIALSTGYSLAVTDVNEAPTALSLSATAFNENIPAGSLVASLSSSDPDTSPQSFSYALVGGAGDTDNLAFFLIGNQLHITRTPDYEVKSSYGIRLKATDQGGLSFERHVQLAVNDLPDSPSYSFSSSAPIVYEGGALALGISSSNVAPGTQIYWSFSGTGISSADLGDGSLSGTSTLGGDGGAGFTKTIAADGVVEGVEGLEVKFFSDSARTQQLGSTIQVSIKEPSVGVVTNGPDLITGTAEAETIRGVPMGSTLRGLGTVDKFTGGGGNDDFVLADTSGVFYDDGNATVSETKDMAWITDFSVGDKITLFGSAANYRLSSAFYSSFRGVLINALLPAATPEPIGFVQSATLASLNLANADQFIYLTAP